jgi:hypothetical protein
MTNHEQRREEGIPQFLQDLKKEKPFITPHNYFKELPDLIMQRIQEEEVRKIKPSFAEVLWNLLRSYLSPKPAWALAVMVVVAAVFFFELEKPSEMLTLEQAISTQEISNYVQSHIDEFDEHDFYTTEVAETDFLGESVTQEDLDPMLDGLIDDIDLETIQRIL